MPSLELWDRWLRSSILLWIGIITFAGVAEARWDSASKIKIESRYGLNPISGVPRRDDIFGGNAEFSNKSKSIRFSGRVEGEWNSSTANFPGAGEGDTMLNTQGSAQWLELTNATLAKRWDGFTLNGGIDVKRWGSVDVYDPLDVVNARRLENPLNPNKRGEGMIQGLFDFLDGELTFEALYIPIKQKPLLPSTRSRWLPREIYIPRLEAIEIELPEEHRYRYTSDTARSDADRDNWGTRLRYRGSIFDSQILFFEGMSSSPSIGVGISGQVTGIRGFPPVIRYKVDRDINLRLTHERTRTVGGVFGLAFANTAVRLTYADTMGVRDSERFFRRRQDTVLAVEQSLTPIHLPIHLLLQRYHNLADRPSDAGNDPTSFQALWDRTTVVGARFTLSELSSLQTAVLIPDELGGRIDLVQLDMWITDWAMLGAEFTQITSTKPGLLSTFDRNDTIAASLRLAL